VSRFSIFVGAKVFFFFWFRGGFPFLTNPQLGSGTQTDPLVLWIFCFCCDARFVRGEDVSRSGNIGVKGSDQRKPLMGSVVTPGSK